ncbi:hypothetical protein EJ110_NYTH43152 [Nymphaea thermarum]|nr:hypothetical protein EJ110_NYTH43152 [Nymphaea thermarum]
MASTGGSSSYASASLNPASSIQWNAFAKKRLQMMVPKPNVVEQHTNTSIAFYTQRGTGRGSFNNFRGFRGGNRVNYGNRTRGRGRGFNGRGFNQNQRDKREGVSCQFCGRKNHTAKTCYDIPKAFAAMAIQSMNDNSWYADSGASHHIAADDTNLNKTNEYKME